MNWTLIFWVEWTRSLRPLLQEQLVLLDSSANERIYQEHCYNCLCDVHIQLTKKTIMFSTDINTYISINIVVQVITILFINACVWWKKQSGIIITLCCVNYIVSRWGKCSTSWNCHKKAFRQASTTVLHYMVRFVSNKQRGHDYKKMRGAWIRCTKEVTNSYCKRNWIFSWLFLCDVSKSLRPVRGNIKLSCSRFSETHDHLLWYC